MTSKLKPEIPAQGWLQFLTAKKEMLDSYDKAKTHSKKHKVETYHGKVAEAEFRKWLSNFLPKKFAVTSGYIISQGIPDTQKAPHFDVIIYEHLESPVLWIENNPDASDQGRSLAIPAEHVKCVLEVKSAFQSSTVKEAISHLSELKILMSSIDPPNEKLKFYLPPNFICGTVFFELRQEDAFDKNALNQMISGISLRGFFGGIILRGEGQIKNNTGRLSLLNSETEMKSMIKKPEWSMLGNWADADSTMINENTHIGAMLSWGEPDFSMFAFDLIAMLNGTYKSGILSSFHALGTTEWAMAREKEIKK
jgi:hypothetical protein